MKTPCRNGNNGQTSSPTSLTPEALPQQQIPRPESSRLHKRSLWLCSSTVSIRVVLCFGKRPGGLVEQFESFSCISKMKLLYPTSILIGQAFAPHLAETTSKKAVKWTHNCPRSQRTMQYTLSETYNKTTTVGVMRLGFCLRQVNECSFPTRCDFT
jgi:hypothetical protein